jgi:hypothetical protein
MENKGLTEQEFANLKSANEAFITAKNRVGDAALFYKRSVDILDASENNLRDMQDQLVAKYGEVTIDTNTGEFK